MPFERKLPVNFVDELRDEFGNNIDASHVKKFATKYAVGYATVSRKLKQFQVKKGTWNLTVQEGREILTKALSAPSVIPSVEQNLIPEVVDTFVPFGNFTDVKKIIQSGIFYPAFITGLSGNGKTFSVEQACAKANRELIRVNISIETDEDDLIGGFRLVDGNTVWHNGPVVEALERGAVLLLDEIDLASNKILCLQSILEGKGVFLKKIGKYVKPSKGFTVVATANTKGKGSEDGRFVGTNVLNEAFLERFPVTFEQNYPHPLQSRRCLIYCLLTKSSTRDFVIGQTLSVRHSLTVVSTRLSVQEDLCISFKHSKSSAIVLRQSQHVSHVLMMKPSKRFKNFTIRLTQT